METRAIDPKFITNISGKEFVTFEGLLNAAHDDGLKNVQTNILQVPTDENSNVCIIQATVETGKGVFTGIGDASAANVGRMIAPHIIRMAETRAVARAFRLACNIGMTAREELGDDDAGAGQSGTNMGYQKSAKSAPAPASNGKKEEEQDGEKNVDRITPAQLKFLTSLVNNDLLTQEQQVRGKAQIEAGLTKKEAAALISKTQEAIEKIKKAKSAKEMVGTEADTY